jgi:hypothetical protein
MTPPRHPHDDSEESRIHIGDLRPADIALLKSVASEAAGQAVKDMLTALGIDPSKPFDAQKDMQWLRSTRERCEGISAKAVLTVIGLLVAAALAALWAGFKSYLK